MASKKRPVIAVIGAGRCSGAAMKQAEEVGREIARGGAILVCGGLGGVMEAASRGAKSEGGVTIGILPGSDKNNANDYIDFAIPTGIGEARNILIIRTADAIVALPGEFGTLSEMAFTMKIGKPLVSLSDWDISDKIIRADSPKEAVREAINLAGRK